MASNSALIEVKDHGRLNGFTPLWRKENHSWWGTRSWLVKILVWVAVIDGLLAMVVFSAPMIEGAETSQAMTALPIEETALGMYFLIAAMLPTFGVIVLGQDALIQERQTGTAAWVLSKPVSRVSVVLSKLSSNGLGVLATMVLVQGIIAYFIYKAGTGISLPIPGFLAGMGMIALFLISVLALTLMLGNLFNSRGLLVGISTANVSGNLLAAMAMPGLGKFMPAYLFWDLGSGQSSLAVTLAQGQPLPTVMPILITALLTILFIIVALMRFEREEF